MATIAISTAGTKLKMGDGGTPTETFTAIEQVYELSGPNESSPTVKITNFDSEAEEYMNGLPDGGEVTFSYVVNPDSTTQASLRSARGGAAKNFKVVWNDATATKTVPSELAFAAVVTDIGYSHATGDKITANAKLKVSGAVTFTARHSGT